MSVSYFKTAAQPAFTGVAVTVGPVEWLQPFPEVTAKVLFRQQFQQDISTWTGLALDTAHGSLTAYILVREGDFQPIGGGQQRWYRYYACTPPQRVEYTSYAAQFPGLFVGTFYRESLGSVTQAKVTLDYFLVGTVPTLARESRATITGFLDQPLLSNVELNLFTSPTVGQYLSAVSADANTPSSFSITAEAQTLDGRWEGNFYARRTLNVKAK